MNRNLNLLFKLLILFSFLLAMSLSGQTFAPSLKLSIVYRVPSHQSPWITPETFRKQAPGIRISSSEVFAVGLKHQTPLFAEIELANLMLQKLEISTYDPETGFLLLGGEGISQEGRLVSLHSEKSTCPKSDLNFSQLSFSNTPLPSYPGETRGFEDEILFYTKSGHFCGIQWEGRIFPPFLIQYFVQKKGRESSFPHIGWEFEANLTPSEQDYYFGPGGDGVLVSKVYPGVGPSYSLFAGDAILSVNGQSLKGLNDKLKFIRVYSSILMDGDRIKQIGSIVKLKLRRNGKIVDIQYPLTSWKENAFLIPERAIGNRPLYFITAGLFFTELSGAYLKEFGEEFRIKTEKKLLYLYDYYRHKNHPGREKLVILSRIFPDESNLGYQELIDLPLMKVNGKDISSLSHLKEVLQNSTDPYLSFEFSGSRFAIFERKERLKLDQRIQESYKIENLDNIR